jgi:MFS family permease
LSALTPADRQVMIGSMQQLALNVGATAAPLLGVLLINVSYRLLFYGEAAAALVYAIVAATLLPRRSDAIDAATAADRLTGKPSYLSVIADRRYLVFLAAVFVNALVYAQYVSTLPLFLRDHGQPTSTYGALLALNSVVVIVGQLPATRLVEGWPARTAAVAGVLLTAVGMTLYGPWWGIAGLVVATLVWSVAECVGTPTVFFSYPVQAAPPLLRGRYLGSVQAIFAAGYAVGPSAGVAVWNASGNAVWWWCGVAGAISVVAMWVAIPVTRAGSATRAPGVEIGAGAGAQT